MYHITHIYHCTFHFVHARNLICDLPY